MGRGLPVSRKQKMGPSSALRKIPSTWVTEKVYRKISGFVFLPLHKKDIMIIYKVNNIKDCGGLFGSLFLGFIFGIF